MNHIDWELVNWSRAQFALTAMYHWIFVPLTLGITFMIAIMETIYLKTQDEKWKSITKFWMKVFGINFAIGVATGLIMEFEFGTNWSNYSWFVGDIFGAPLAIEGIMAFFMESTFIAVMFFGWDRVSPKFHLLSSWLVAIGSNLSALWILVANGWMQNPTGTSFNPDTMRNEMIDFWAVLFNPVAVNKFLHTVISSYIVSALFVVGISAWYLLKRRDIVLAKRSMLVASVFGFLATIGTFWSGDESARQVAATQPMKLAAMEGLYEGDRSAPLIAMGIFGEQDKTVHKKEQFLVEFKIPKALSYLAFLDSDKFVPGISDLVHGNEKEGISSYDERIASGKIAIDALGNYVKAKKNGDLATAGNELKTFRAHEKDFGYGYYFGKNPHMLIPNVKMSFYSFHIMVILGTYFLVLFIILFVKTLRGKLDQSRSLLRLTLWSIPLGYVASQSGWIVAEVGRQPWTIQNLLPNIAAVSQIDAYSVQITFFLFLIIFTTLLIAEIKIMLSAIKKELNINSKKTKIMFSFLDYSGLQHYWWILVSLLGALLVFLLFVQGGQSLIYTLASNEKEKTMLLNSTGRKWEITFTTLVTFGGAFFASFPLFYSTSFGGAYWVWMAILFAFILQAVSYEFRSKANNFLGHKTFEVFLFLNGVLGSLLLGVAVSTFFTGAEFSVNKINILDISSPKMPIISAWETPFHGLEALWTTENLAFVQNVSLGLAVFFLSRVLANLYFQNNIKDENIYQKSQKSLIYNSVLFLIFFLFWLIRLLFLDGFAVNPSNGEVFMEPNKYLHNFLEMPLVLAVFLIGVVMVLAGIAANMFFKSKKGIWFSGLGTVLTVWMLFLIAGFNNTAFYPSTHDLQSSLTIYNASSSEFTLKTMSYVSLLVPFVVAYIALVWKKMDSKKISSEELKESENHVY